MFYTDCQFHLGLTKIMIMKNIKINFREKFEKFSEYWKPKVITELNDYQFKLVKIKGDFIWHNHQETDEAFIVLDGKYLLNLRKKQKKLMRGK